MNLKETILVRKYKNIKIVINDMIFNIIATIIPIFVLQFLLLPIVAQRYTEQKYGLVLTLISLITLSVQSLSVSLSNSRLLMNQTYKEYDVEGDFNILLIIYCIVNIIVLLVGTYLYEGYFNIINIVSILLISVIQLLRRYLLVSFRLQINYKAILYSNFVLVIGYMIGMLFFLLTGLWQFIYLIGELICFVYVIKKTDLLREPIQMTALFRKTTKHGIIILGSSFLGTAITNIDRLLLYPILGAKAVTVYYVATLFGKTLSMLIGPINNVILTYLSRMKKFKRDSFNLMIIVASILGILSYIIIIIVSEPILRIMYPTYVDDSMKLIYITTSTAIIQMLSNVINPVILRFCNISWQIWINAINILIYILLAFYLIGVLGIYGFCFAALITSIVKVIIMILIYYKNSYRSPVKE